MNLLSLRRGCSAKARERSAQRRVLIIVENLPVPFDRRVWSEATSLRAAGYDVSVICPKGKGARKGYEVVDGVHIYRHPMPFEARGPIGYLLEYSTALFWEFVLSIRVFVTRGFDAVHACNPPDLLFLIAGFYKFAFGKRFIFDHHDISPELYEAKFSRRNTLWRLLVMLERATFSIADVSIATNASYRQIAIERGHMDPSKVHIVRSGPRLDHVKTMPSDQAWKKGRQFLVGYVGVIGAQEGLDLLMRSVKHILEKGRRDLQFAVVGDGPTLGDIKALAQDLGVADFVTFVGRADDSTLFTILSTADVCVNPDRPNAMNDKSTMNKILEYMALGKPIVQYDLTEGRFSAQGASLYARNGEPIDFAEKILELLNDPNARARMGELGRARVLEELAWSHEEPKLLQAYDMLFERHA